MNSFSPQSATPASRIRLDAAAGAVADASVFLSIWHAGDDADQVAGDRIRAGHATVRQIDAAVAAMYDARAALATEIHQSNVERAAAVDQLLADLKSQYESGTR